jgi:hypothetical protein
MEELTLVDLGAKMSSISSAEEILNDTEGQQQLGIVEIKDSATYQAKGFTNRLIRVVRGGRWRAHHEGRQR